MNPIGFDPFSMTDQELLDKSCEIHKRLTFAGRFSNDGRLVEQLQNMAASCAFAQNERNQQRMFETLNKNQSDEVDVTAEPKKKVAKTNGKDGRPSTTREGSFRAARTRTPVKE
jgi:roadblock/LC7 domain-containing protein